MATKQLWAPIHSTEKNKELQKELSAKVANINAEITQINKLPLSLRDYSFTSISQIFIHHNVEKTSYIKKNDKKKNVRAHIPKSALVDGCHVPIDIAEKWFVQIHKVAKIVVDQI